MSPAKRGARWEIIRLERMRRDRLARVAVKDVKPADVADWRDRRLEEVAPSSVTREMNLLSAVFSIAVKEWGVLPANPVRDVRRPKEPPARNRRVSDAEVAALRAGAPNLGQASGRAIHAFRFAIETGMRAGEICGLRPDDVTGNVAHLPRTKNGEPRDVPLSTAALALLAELPPADPVFGISPKSLDVLFRRVRDAAGIEGLTFHDSRGEAATRLAKKLDPFELARVLGHRDLKQTLRYFKATAHELAERLG